MRRYLLTVALACTAILGYAQKAELSAAQKAFDKNDFATALKQAEAAQSLINSNPEASQDFKLKAKTLIGASQANLAKAAKDFDKIGGIITLLSEVVDFEKEKDYSAVNISTKKTKSFANQAELDAAMQAGTVTKPKIVDRDKTYTPIAQAAMRALADAAFDQGVAFYNEKNYNDAAHLFDITYDAQTKYAPRPDTTLISNSAVSMMQIPDYKEAAKYYQKLVDLGYTGVETIYEAVMVDGGQKRVFGSQKEMDAEVKLKIVKDPVTRTEPSKLPGNYLTLVKLLVQGEDFDTALKYTREGKAKFPQEKEFLLIEGEIYYNTKQMDKFLQALKEGAVSDPKDATIQYNMGFVYSELKDSKSARECYMKAIELDPKYTSAYTNLVALILEKEQGINAEIDKLPFTMNAAQTKKYKELIASKKVVYQEALVYLLKAYENIPDNVTIIKTISNIYAQLEDQANADKFSAIEKKLMGL